MTRRLRDHSPRSLELAIAATPWTAPFPIASDREAWTRITEEIGAESVAEQVAAGEWAAAEGVPPLPASLWLEHERTGERYAFEGKYFRRRELLCEVVLAECMEWQGRFLDPILDLAWATCEESCWAFPSHHPPLADMTKPHIDLGVAETALMLAELDTLLGDVLPEPLGSRIGHEVNHRCIEPLLRRHDWGWLYPLERGGGNWTAVCCGGLAGAAIHLERDPARLAEVIARVATSLDDYLATFDASGGSSEGVLYWSYGFGHYALAAQLIEHRTGGAVAMFAGERMREIARFPLRTRLSRLRYATFADCRPRNAVPPSLPTFLARRLDVPELYGLAAEQPPAPERPRLCWRLRDVVWRPPADRTRVRSREHDWLSGVQWMVSRLDPGNPDALALAAKAGHNGELHNHNDVGNIELHIGQESIVADLGMGRYRRRYFEAATRYEYAATSSWGHSVPVVNGRLQQAGERHRAREVAHESTADADTLSMELRDAYPADAGLTSLRRSIALHRTGELAGAVELRDDARFVEAGRLECPLITIGDAALEADAAVLRGSRASLRARFDPNQVEAEIETVPDVELMDDIVTMRRVVFRPRRPSEHAVVRIVLTPMPA